MREEREYQQKMLNSKKGMVICNWKRRSGKTDSIVQKILSEKEGRFLILANHVGYMTDCIESGINPNISIRRKQMQSEITHEVDGKLMYIIIKDNSAIIEKNVMNNLDLVFYDEYIPNGKEIDSLRSMGAKQIYVVMTDENIEYIDGVSEEDFYDKQINKLKEEFDNTANKENTTKTRESLLNMIERMERLKTINKNK